MIIIKNGDKQIYHPWNPALQLINPKLILEDNAAGSLTFKIYSDNLNYDSIRKLAPVLSVIRNGRTIFKGRAVSDRKDFYNGKSVEVEGKLAFFNDSQMEPFQFEGSPGELFSLIVESHNTQVKDWQRFKVGVVTVTDPNDYIIRSSESAMNTWKALKEKCFNSSLGGHIRIRYEGDGDYIDWLSDYETVSKQSIEFAKNMIDLSTGVDATETYTAIRPIGAEVEGVKIDISSVNEGKNYLINEEKAAEYGIIFAPVEESTWEDVTLPENLLKKARERLYSSFPTMKETYEIRAVDLNLTNESIEALDICEYVPVVSRPHGINGNYLLSRAEIYITKPQNSVFYLGANRRVLSDLSSSTVIQPGSSPQNISAFVNDAHYISVEETEEMLSDYTSTEQVQEISLASSRDFYSASGNTLALGNSREDKFLEFALYGKALQGADPSPDNPQEITITGAGGSVTVTATSKDGIEGTTAVIDTGTGLAGIPVASGGNYTDASGQRWICDSIEKYADGTGKAITRIGSIESYNGESITTDWISATGELTTGEAVFYVLSEYVENDLSAEQITEIEKLQTYHPVTNISNDAGCGMKAIYPVSETGVLVRRLYETVNGLKA